MAMYAKAIYLKLDAETWEALQKSAEADLRLIPDQAAWLLRQLLVERANSKKSEAAIAAR